MGPFYQSETNVAAHGMSSYQEARWRYDDVDPELLQDPFDVAEQARLEKARQQELLEQSAQRPLSVDAAKLVMNAASETPVRRPDRIPPET